MSSNHHDALLLSRRYSEDLQQLFASLSGDYNPMHVDPVAARRTLVGGRAVHGIHLALTAMEALLAWSAKQNQPRQALAGFTALFLKPVLVEDVVEFHLIELTGESCRITGKIDGEVVCKITIPFGPATEKTRVELLPLTAEPVAELRFDELTDRAGSVVLGLDLKLAHQLFPLTTAALGDLALAETLALSRLVGMHCPGLHSIFGQAAVRYDGAGVPGGLNYRVEQTDDRFGRVVMAVHGSCLQGQLQVFFRPPPVLQAGMIAVASAVTPGSFAHSIALIVGGSRGLGEVTAKIIAAGGGIPIITYYQGKTDAEKVVEDVRSRGGRCEMLPLDVRNGEAVIRQLVTGQNPPTSIYYFATPKIFGRRRGFFSHDMLDEFAAIYVAAFGRLIDAAATASPGKLRVFYPSSVAVNEELRELVEYAMAKRQAEELCAFYNKHSKKIEIVVERLPRIKTDQTSTLSPFPAESALEVMLPIVRRVENVSAP